MDYFVSAGREFCKHTPFSFDPESYAEMAKGIIESPDVICIVDGDPVRCHCAAKLVPSLYDSQQVVARVFTTWGRGGLNCFERVEGLCREAGAHFLIADALIAPAITRFYERRGMKQIDTLFMKAL